MKRFMIWLSGADRTLLRECRHLQDSEETRFAGLGLLVLVPALLGLCSMTYALSTVTGHPYFYVPGGLLWFVIVVAIDRYLVSTLHKTSLPHRQSSQVVAIVARFIFAIFVGIAVSHPLILLWFDDSISEQLAQDKRQQVNDIRRTTERRVSQLDETSPSAVELADKIEQASCLVELQTAEQSGQVVQLPCGFSSGLADCQQRCAVIERRLDEVNAEIDTLRAIVDGESDERAAEADRIRAQARARIASLRENFSRDYLAKVRALATIEAESHEVTVVRYFMLLFFVLVDVLPLTLKVTTPMGEYERIRDTHVAQAELEQQAALQVLQGTEASPTVIEDRIQARAFREWSSNLAMMSVEALRLFERTRREYEEVAKRVEEDVRSGGDSNEQESVYEYIDGLRQSMGDSFRAIVERLRTIRS